MLCRSRGPSMDGPIAMASQGNMMQAMMQMQQAFMMQVMQQRRGLADDDLDVQFAPGVGQPKRSLRAMLSGPACAPALPATWKRYKPGALVDAPPIAAALADAPARADAPIDAPIDAAHVDAPAALVDAAAKAPADAAVSQVDAPQVGAPQVASPATRGSCLLDAMIERDRERSEIKKQEKVAEKDAEKARKAVGKAPEKTCKLPIAKAAGAKLAKKVGNADLPKKKVNLNHEASRSQYLARSAGPSKSFAYGAGKEYSTAAKAMAAAKVWLQRQ